jgi:hypothetical protein
MDKCCRCLRPPKPLYTLTDADKALVTDVTQVVIDVGVRNAVADPQPPASQPATRAAPAVPTAPAAKETAVGGRKMPSLSSAQLATMSVELLLQTVMQPERMEHAESVELCFKQLRVLCRDDWTCDQCDRLGANDQIIRLMRLHLGSESVLTQACAVLINLCAGDSYERRDRAQLGGAPDVILKAMEAHPNSAILQEMSFVAMQNISFGSDPNGKESDPSQSRLERPPRARTKRRVRQTRSADARERCARFHSRWLKTSLPLAAQAARERAPRSMRAPCLSSSHR